MIAKTSPAFEEYAGQKAYRLLEALLEQDHDWMEARWAEFGLTPAQGNLLRRLNPGEPTAMAALARALQCHGANVTNLVDKLEARKLVERRSAVADRRVKEIWLTDLGARTLKEMLPRLREPLPFIRDMSANDQKILATILQRAYASNQRRS